MGGSGRGSVLAPGAPQCKTAEDGPGPPSSFLLGTTNKKPRCYHLGTALNADTMMLAGSGPTSDHRTGTTSWVSVRCRRLPSSARRLLEADPVDESWSEPLLCTFQTYIGWGVRYRVVVRSLVGLERYSLP